MALEIFRLVGSVFVDTDQASKSLQRTDKNATSLGKSLINGVKAVGKFAAGVAATVTAAGTAILTLVETTREYRTEMGKLEAAFEASNHSAETATSAYKSLVEIIGETDQSVEAAQQIALLADSEKEVAQWSELAAGVVGRFGDALQPETFFEAANETLKLGEATGAYTQMLEGTGIDVEKFNKKLAKLNTEEEKQNYLLSVAEQALGAAGAAYRETNADVIAANAAQDQLNDTLAKIGGVIEPIITQGKVLLAEVLEKATPYATQLASIVIPWLVAAISGLVEWVDDTIQAVKDAVAWLQKMGSYSAETLQPIIDDLAVAFEWVKRQLEPFIEALEDYFTSGQAAEDITNAVKTAVDFLAEAYQTVKDLIKEVSQNILDANTWMREHETLVTLIAIAVGTLTAAVTAYNVAQAIKNAGGIAEIAELAAIQIGIWGLTAAEAARTAATTVATTATTIATAATTAFGAALAFVTSPITLIILAIGALIAIVYLLIKHWDTVKEVAIKCWEWVKETWNKAADWFNTKVVQPVVKFFVDLGASIREAFVNAWNGVKNTWSSVVGFFSGIWTSIKNTFSNVTGWFRDTFSKAWQAVKNVFSTGGKIFDGIKDGIANVFKTVVNAIIRGINKVIAVPFNKINSILARIRNISIAGISPFSWLTSSLAVPQIPQLEEGGVLKRGQVGILEGNGAEAVVPLEKNKRWISAVAQDMDSAIGGGSSGQVVAVLLDILAAIEALAELGIYLDKDKLVGELAKPLDRKLGQIQAAKGRA